MMATERKGTGTPKPFPRCGFCDEPTTGHSISTGVSMYPACIDCARLWWSSDRTREALHELFERGDVHRERA